MVLFSHLCLVGFIVLFVTNVPEEGDIYTTLIHQTNSMTVGFIGMNIISTTLMSLNEALISKSISRSRLSRGSLMGATAMFSSFGVLTIDGVGGNIYPDNRRNPFYLCLGSEGIIVLLIISLAFAR